MYIVYSEVIGKNGIERYFHGAFYNQNKANDVALALSMDNVDNVWHCVCNESEVHELNIKNYH